MAIRDRWAARPPPAGSANAAQAGPFAIAKLEFFDRQQQLLGSPYLSGLEFAIFHALHRLVSESAMLFEAVERF